MYNIRGNYIKADRFIVLIPCGTGCMFCQFHVHVVPFRRSMETLCSCWRARWWWSIWGWSWGLRWSSATTSTSSSRASRDAPLSLRCRRRPLAARRERLYRHASANCASRRGLYFGDIVRQTPVCPHFRCIVGTNGSDLMYCMFVIHHGAGDPPLFTKLPKTTNQVHRNRALVLYRWSSLISIAVIWIDKRLVNSSEPNGSSRTSNVKP